MLTTNTTRVRAKEDDGKRRVVTTTTMKPAKVRFMQSEFPGVQKREMRKVDSSVKFNTTELSGLMNSMGYKRVVKPKRIAPIGVALEPANDGITLKRIGGNDTIKPGDRVYLDPASQTISPQPKRAKKAGRKPKA